MNLENLKYFLLTFTGILVFYLFCFSIIDSLFQNIGIDIIVIIICSIFWSLILFREVMEFFTNDGVEKNV